MLNLAGIQRPEQRVSRRAFLCGLGATVTGTLLVACGPPRSNNQATIAFGPQATPQVILPSPIPQNSRGTDQAVPGLEAFLALSALLTGVTNLNPGLGQIYWQSLQASDEFAVTVDDLLAQAGFSAATPPTTLAALEATGIFDQEAARTVADKITELWYTGVYTDEAGEARVATYADALAWRALAFTKPTTICSYPGFWSEAWEPVLD